MRKNKIYLDTNILVALIAEKPGDSRLAVRKTEATNALNTLSSLNFVFYVSSWTLTEMVKVLINEYTILPKRVAIIHNGITNTSSVNGFDIKIIGVSSSKSFSCENLFLNVREIMTNYNPGWGDAFHCVIMRQNKIETILSGDGKNDFKIIPGLKLLHPKNVTPQQS